MGVRKLRLLTRDELDDLPDPQWLVRKVMQVETLTVLYGPSGHGKTFVALDIALAISTGRSWHGADVRQGTVVYVTSEGLAGLKARIGGWENHYGQRIESFRLVPDQPQLLSENDVTALIAAIREGLREPPALIVIDTLARHFVGGEENSAQDMGRLVAATDELKRQFQCSTMLVHHTGKNGVLERGSTALRASADTMILVKSDNGRVRLHCDKQKEDEGFRDTHFRLKPVTVITRDGQCYSTCVVVPGAPAEDRSPNDGSEDAFGVQDLSKNEERLLRVYVDDMDAAYLSGELESESGLKPATFSRVLRKLFEDVGLLEKTGQRLYRLTARGRRIVQALKPEANHH